MPQNSKYDDPRLGLCHVRGEFFSGQPLSSLKKGACQATKAVNIGRKQV